MPGAVPPAASVRREVAAVVAAYALPPVLTVGALVVVAVFWNWRPLALLAVFLAFGMVGPLARHLRGRWRERRRTSRRGRPRGPVDAETRAAIAAIAPELSVLDMVRAGPDVSPRVDGKRLLIGTAWMGPERPGTALSDYRFFALAHEARHQTVNAFALMRCFRVVRAAQVSAAGSVYTSILLNVAAVADDPYRWAVTAAAVLLPYVAGMLRAVLDEASNALEWRLELDADAAAVARCLEAGRLSGIPSAEHVLTLFDRADAHGPVGLRSSALGGASVARSVTYVLLAGWAAINVPFAASVLFALTVTSDPDLYNLLLALVLGASVFIAGGTVLAAAHAGPAGRPKVGAAACVLGLRVYLAATRLLAWAVSLFTLLFLAGLLRSALGGKVPGAEDIAAIAVSLAAMASYIGASSSRLRERWIAAAAAADALRLWVLVWLLRASGVLPFFDDVGALGSALRDNPLIIWNEMVRMWQGDRLWLAFAAMGSLAWAALVAFLVIRAKALLLPRRAAGARRIPARLPGKCADVHVPPASPQASRGRP